MLRRLFGGKEPTPEEKLGALLAKRLGEPIARTEWNHACPICGWPWRPTWHVRDGNPYALWSSCGACLAIAVDMVGWTRDTNEPVSMVTFFFAEQELARWVIADLGTLPAYESGEEPRLLGPAAYVDFRWLPDWDGRCPACRARWRADWWVDEHGPGSPVSACGVCHLVLAFRIPAREAHWFDLTWLVGFKIIDDLPDPINDDEWQVGETIRPEDWPEACPACDAPMDNPAYSLETDDQYGVPMTRCPDCPVWAELWDLSEDDPPYIRVLTKANRHVFDKPARWPGL